MMHYELCICVLLQLLVWYSFQGPNMGIPTMSSIFDYTPLFLLNSFKTIKRHNLSFLVFVFRNVFFSHITSAISTMRILLRWTNPLFKSFQSQSWVEWHEIISLGNNQQAITFFLSTLLYHEPFNIYPLHRWANRDLWGQQCKIAQRDVPSNKSQVNFLTPY